MTLREMWDFCNFTVSHFPSGSDSKSLQAMQETWVCSLSWEDPLEKEMATQIHSSYLESSMDRGPWWAAVHGVTKNPTRLRDFTFNFTKKLKRNRVCLRCSCWWVVELVSLGWNVFLLQHAKKRSFNFKETACMPKMRVQSLGQEDPIEKKMATHSSLLAWEILWTEEPRRLQGSQRVRHDLATKQQELFLNFQKWT